MSISKTEWSIVSKSVSGQRQEDRIQQQAVFRLIDAVSKNDHFMIDKLLYNGVFIDAPLLFEGPTSSPAAKSLLPIDYPFDQMNALAFAAFTNDVSLLEILISKGADPSFPGPQGRDALWMALWSNSNSAWDYLKNQDGIVWGLRAGDGKRSTRLMDAVRRRNVEACRDILAHVDTKQVDNTGRTALHYNFLQNPYTEVDAIIARMLVEYDAPVSQEDHEGVSPAALASTPEQVALIDRANLAEITMEAQRRAQEQRQHLDALEPTPMPEDPTEPTIPQIKKPVKLKRIM